MDSILFKYEFKKILSQKSTKIISLVLLIFPVVIVFGIVSPSPQFSITMADFTSAADFSNAILGFLNSLGFYYVILILFSSTVIIKEIESKYIYFVLSAIPNHKKLFLYKILSVVIIFNTVIFLSQLCGFFAYSILYLGKLEITFSILGTLFWGLLISILVSMIFMFIFVSINIVIGGSVMASLTLAVSTIILFIVMSAIKSIMFYLPAFALDYLVDRNNLVLILLYTCILTLVFILFKYIIDRKQI